MSIIALWGCTATQLTGDTGRPARDSGRESTAPTDTSRADTSTTESSGSGDPVDTADTARPTDTADTGGTECLDSWLDVPDDGIDQDCDGADAITSESLGVFVATTGDDGNPGTMAEPVATIARAHAIAKAREDPGNWVVYMAEGTYVESVELQGGVSIFGGYDATSWTRDVSARTTRLESDGTALDVLCCGASLLVDGIEIEAVTGIRSSVPREVWVLRSKVWSIGAEGESWAVDVSIGSGVVSVLQDTEVTAGPTGTSGAARLEGHVTVDRCVLRGGTQDDPAVALDTTALEAYAESDEWTRVSNSWIEGGSVAGPGSATAVRLTSWDAVFANNHIAAGRTAAGDPVVVETDFLRGALVNNYVWADDDQVAASSLALDDDHDLRFAAYNNAFYGPFVDTDAGALDACAWADCQGAGGNVTAACDVDSASCVDAGIDPSPWMDVDTDHEGDPRPAGATWDIGWDEAS